MVDKTMMGDKCAELVRAAMIGALAVTLGNPTAVYAAEEETADPGQIGMMRWKRKVDPREKKMRQSRRNRNRRSLTAERMQE